MTSKQGTIIPYPTDFGKDGTSSSTSKVTKGDVKYHLSHSKSFLSLYCCTLSLTKKNSLENIVYHFLRQLWLVLGVKLMEINSNLFSRRLHFVSSSRKERDRWYTKAVMLGPKAILSSTLRSGQKTIPCQTSRTVAIQSCDTPKKDPFFHSILFAMMSHQKKNLNQKPKKNTPLKQKSNWLVWTTPANQLLICSDHLVNGKMEPSLFAPARTNHPPKKKQRVGGFNRFEKY